MMTNEVPNNDLPPAALGHLGHVALKSAAMLAATRNISGDLRAVYIAVDDGTTNVSAYGHEGAVEWSFPSGWPDMDLAVPADTLGRVMRSIGDDWEILHEGVDLTFKRSPLARYSIRTMAVTSPEPRRVDEVLERVEVDAAVLHRIAGHVALAASDDILRHDLRRIHVLPGPNATAMASDSYRAAWTHLGAAASHPFSIPAKILPTVVKALDDQGESTATVAVGEEMSSITVGRATFTFSSSGRQLPAPERFLEKEVIGTVEFDAQPLIAATLRLAAVREKGALTNALVFDLNPVAPLIRIPQNKIGAASEPLEATVTGNVPSLTINGALLTDALRTFGTGRVVMRVRGDLQPLELTLDNPDAQDLSWIIMPMCTPQER